MLELALYPEKFQSKEFLCNALKLLKQDVGSHSPSINLIQQELGCHVKLDGCFLSNPYATDLFLSYFENEILKENLLGNLFSYYPSQNRTLAKLVSKNLQIEPEKIFIGNGAIEIIQAIIHRFCGESILVTLPTFSPYYEYAEKKMKVVFFMLKKENNFEFDIPEYVKLVFDSQVDSIVLVTPNNPTGNYLTKTQVEYILQACKHLKCIVLDESFIHFAYEDEELNLVSNQSLLDKYPNLVIVKSLSKDFGLAGIRAGYALMHPQRVDDLLADGYLWNSNQFVEYFLTLLSCDKFMREYENVRKQFIHEVIAFHRQLQTIHRVKVYPTMSNFALIELLHNSAEQVVLELLMEYGIYLRNCNDKLGLDGAFIRVAARKQLENQLMINALRKTVTDNI